MARTLFKALSLSALQTRNFGPLGGPRPGSQSLEKARNLRRNPEVQTANGLPMQCDRGPVEKLQLDQAWDPRSKPSNGVSGNQEPHYVCVYMYVKINECVHIIYILPEQSDSFWIPCIPILKNLAKSCCSPCATMLFGFRDITPYGSFRVVP